MNIAQHFSAQEVARLDLSQYSRVASGTTVSDTVARMNADGSNCAFVIAAGRLEGIFTDRDVLAKIVDRPERWSDPIESAMTHQPVRVAPESSAMDALRQMNERRVRNVPVVASDGTVTGNLTHFSLMRFAEILIGNEARMDESGFSVHHSFLYITFAGLMSDKPIAVAPETTIAEVVETMRARDVGSVIVVDERGAATAMFTERDLLKKIACRVEDPGAERVGRHASALSIELEPDDPIAKGLHFMAEKRIRRLPLLSETRKPLGIVSFRDIARYIETSFSL